MNGDDFNFDDLNDSSFDSMDGFDELFDSNDNVTGNNKTTDGFDKRLSNNTEEKDDELSGFSNKFKNFNNNDNYDDSEEDEPEQKGIKKTAIGIIVAGVIILLIVIVIASKIGKSSKNQSNSNTQVQTTVQTNIETQSKVQTQVANNTANTTNNSWKEIDSSENIVFNKDYSTIVFTVTQISNLAKTIDSNNNLIIKTTLTGSLAGLSGTYTLDVPYDKGIKLKIGNSFNVQVQLGTFKEKTVVGEIKY